jgi:hypothetical protein
MADRVLFISWGQTVRGAEEHALEVFNDALGILGRMQQDGRIEGFDVVLLNANGDLGGYIEVAGTAQQLAGVQDDEEFMRNTIDADLCVDNIRHIMGYANEGVARTMAMYQEAIAKIPQRA